jgi:hypothetical protein
MMRLKEKQEMHSASSAFSLSLILGPIIIVVDRNIIKTRMLRTTHTVPTPILTLTTKVQWFDVVSLLLDNQDVLKR